MLICKYVCSFVCRPPCIFNLNYACMYVYIMCHVHIVHEYDRCLDACPRGRTCLYIYIYNKYDICYIYLGTSVYLRLLGKHACLSTKGCHLVLWGYGPVRGFILVHHYWAKHIHVHVGNIQADSNYLLVLLIQHCFVLGSRQTIFLCCLLPHVEQWFCFFSRTHLRWQLRLSSEPLPQLP